MHQSVRLGELIWFVQTIHRSTVDIVGLMGEVSSMKRKES